jgi:DNA modification methylase
VNWLFYGDNLDVLRRDIARESVDLVYLDPPFNSNRTYNVLFKHKSGKESQAQIEAFDDTWTWSQEAEAVYLDVLTHGSPKVADTVEAMRKLLGENDVLAYLVMMTARLIELRRVLRPTGSLYLHCDPTASHYLKVVLDAVFGSECFRSEVIWKRTTAHNSARRYGPVHDVIFFYSKSSEFTWVPQHQPYDERYVKSKYRFTDARGLYRLSDITGPGVRTGPSGEAWRGYDPGKGGRHWQPPSYCYDKYRALTGDDLAKYPLLERLNRLEEIGLIYWPDKDGGRPEHRRYLADMPGVPLQDVWTDIDPINARADERLGYPTQKPVTLLQRIISASSNSGDVVLDPFCGCGTAIDAAQRLGRQWIGIDITYLAIDLIDTRLKDTFGPDIASTYRIEGIPRDVEGARRLFAANPFDFERWAVSLVDGTPNEKQVGDRGSDGVIRFPLDAKAIGRAIVSVKGGRQINPSMVRDLAGTVEAQRAQMGVLILMDPATPGMTDAARHSGTFKDEMTWRDYPKVQIVTVGQLLGGKRVDMPQPFMPYLAAQRFVPDHPQLPGMSV